jgi:catechol 2,3-dioxygenase-like lactoylglutathione lyase family enzyme
MGILDHVDFAVTDLARSRDFYTQALAPLGIVPLIEIKRDDGREGTGFGANGFPQFWIGRGERLSGRLHIAFRANTREAVDAFHEAAIAAGGRNHGEPGLRPQYGESCYAAFVVDPNGHVIEAMCRHAET